MTPTSIDSLLSFECLTVGSVLAEVGGFFRAKEKPWELEPDLKAGGIQSEISFALEKPSDLYVLAFLTLRRDSWWRFKALKLRFYLVQRH